MPSSSQRPVQSSRGQAPTLVPSPDASNPQTIVVIGAGIGGLTAAALLAKRGYRVRVFDQALVPGGCASTFKRRGFTFDVGATQVAGLEPGGIHFQIFEELGIDLPNAAPCDPACAVYLPGETTPISVWRDPGPVAGRTSATVSGERTVLAVDANAISGQLAVSAARPGITAPQPLGSMAASEGGAA